MSETANHLYKVPIRVRRGANCKMPAHLVGAIVCCYSAAPTHLEAVRISAQKLAAEGYVFEELEGGQVHEIDPATWDEYVVAFWPQQRDYFPPQTDIPRFIEAGGVFFGPVLGWEAK